MNANRSCLVTFTLGPATFNAAGYFPIDFGRWTYLENGTLPYTLTILPETVTVNGVPTKVFQDSRDGYQEFYTSDGTGTRLHRQFYLNELIPGIGTVDLTLTYVPPLQMTSGVGRMGELDLPPQHRTQD